MIIRRFATLLIFTSLLSPTAAKATTARATEEAASCHEDTRIINAPSLTSWERELLRDCNPASRLGDVRPFDLPVSISATARAHFMLGLKALHTFFYDLCKFEFDAAIESDPSFRMAYWGRSLCDAQLLWNAENVTFSHACLRRAPSEDANRPRDVLYFNSVWALNGGDNPPTSESEVIRTRPARYNAYLDILTNLSDQYPNDETARAFVALATLATGSVGKCALSNPDPICVTQLARARELLKSAYNNDPTFPGYLHYGMHASDFPSRDVVEAGLVYARDYPRYVTSTTHSLHMPSHLYDRSGNYRAGQLSNQASVRAADTFAQGGALDDMKMNNPYAFNAGNLYHSLEYEHYELTQICAVRPARMRLLRMIRAASQSMSFPDVPTSAAMSSASPWFLATTYTQWEMKMLARQTMWGIATSLMSSSSNMVGDEKNSIMLKWREQWVGITNAPALPRLSWKSTTVYSHAFYSPSAEAGYYAALALALLFDALKDVRASGAVIEAVNSPDVCGSRTASMTREGILGPLSNEHNGCVGQQVGAALEIIDQAEEHYTNLGIRYEASFVKQLGLHVRAMLHIVNGDNGKALSALSEATKLERDAPSIILPSSTSVFFMPSSAWDGILRLSFPLSDAEKDAHEFSIQDSFSQCLSFAGHPNMPLCLVGKARSASSHNEATESYLQLLDQWGSQKNGTQISPQCECSILLREARCAVGWDSKSGTQGVVEGDGQDYMITISLSAGLLGLMIGLAFGVALGARGKCNFCTDKMNSNAQKRMSEQGIGQVKVEKNRLLVDYD